MSDNVLTLTFLLPDAFLPGWNHDKAASWQGDRLSVLTPSARRLIDSVCTCASVCARVCVCVGFLIVVEQYVCVAR